MARFCAVLAVAAALVEGPTPRTLAAAPAAASTSETLTGTDACALVEGVPAGDHPIRKAGAWRAGFRRLARSKGEPEKLARVYASLKRTRAKLLDRARAVFHPKQGDVSYKKAQRFLQRHVMSANPDLVIEDARFAAPSAVRATMVYAACRGGDRKAALHEARAASAAEPAMAAMAALLLLEQGREAEARELLPRMDEQGFIGPWMLAELSRDADARRRLNATARRRVSNPEQLSAVTAQKKRFEQSPLPEPDPFGRNP